MPWYVNAYLIEEKRQRVTDPCMCLFSLSDADRPASSCRPSISPWKSPCTTKLSSSSTPGGTNVRWDENALPWWVPAAPVLPRLRSITTAQTNIIIPSYMTVSSLVLDEVEKQSTCELEVDAVAVDVLNRLEIESKCASGLCFDLFTQKQKELRQSERKCGSLHHWTLLESSL